MSDEILTSFASGITIEEQGSALGRLVANRQLNRVAREPAFDQGMLRLARFVADPGLQTERLIALAALSRIASTVKSLRSRVSELLSTALLEPLPSLQAISDPDSRFYIVSAWRFSQQSWWKGYLSTAAIEEDSAERIRQKCLEGLIALSSDLGTAIGELRGPVASLRFRTEKPGDSLGRRLRRVLTALRTSFAKSDTEPGSEAGVELAEMLKNCFRSSGKPTEARIVHELAEEVGKLVHELVRARFSLATSPSTYSAIYEAQTWFKAYEWERFTEESKSYSLVARDIREALSLLVRAGISDDELFQRLALAVGSMDRARAIGRELVDHLKGLPEHLRDWLLGKTTRTKSSLATESQERALDEVIAELLIETSRLSQLAGPLRQNTLTEIAVVAPQTADSVRSFVTMCESIANTIRLLASRRALQIRDTTAQEVEFSPLEHEMAGGPKAGIRRVRLISPIVESIGRDGTIRIVRKALVEPVEKVQD
jgi:hypothetical protein